jgi:UTP--glucose-1-phosphate uridylyltransferase
MKKIKKAIIPVAGKGTRMLPMTKALPKELLPLGEFPVIHHVVEEAVHAGIEQIIFVVSQGKESILNYFSRNFELEMFLEKNGKEKDLRLVQEIGDLVDVVSVYQKEQLGLGHAILQAEKIVGDEPFAVLLGDDLIRSRTSVISQMMKATEHLNTSVISVMQVPLQDVSKYGIVDGVKDPKNPRLYRMKSMIEKPKPEKAPTQLACPGRYLFTPEIFEHLKNIPRGVGNEYQLTDAINLLAQKQLVMAYEFEGIRYDVGSHQGYRSALSDWLTH